MTQTLPKLVTFEEFAAWRPEGGRYELRDGVIVEMVQPVGGEIVRNKSKLKLIKVIGQDTTITYDRVISKIPCSASKVTVIPTGKAAFAPS